jgi:hypothetical protein
LKCDASPVRDEIMGLSEIAAGLEVTAEQDDRGVATVDETGAGLADRLAPHADALPCTAAAAATLVSTYTAGTSVGECAREAGVAPMTAAKALHRCGVEGLSPLAPTGRRVVRDWLAGELARTEAETLTDADPAEFVLAAYVEAHEPDPALVAAVDGALAEGSVDERTPLSDAVEPPGDLR